MRIINLPGLLLATAVASGAAWANIDNSDFQQVEAFAEETVITYGAESGPPAWRLVVADSAGGSVTAGVEDAADGSAWFSFTALDQGFGDNKLEQCVAIDASRPLEISYQVRADTPTVDAAGIRVRINPNFYADFEACGEAILADAGGDRLSGNRNNDDMDFDLGATGGQAWITVGPDEDSGLRYEVDDFPEGAQWMRISVRARDRSGIEPPAVVRFDDLRVVQGGVNLLVNGSFEHRELFDGDFVVGDSGWFVDRDTAEQRAAVGPQAAALAGDNVFYFEDLQGGFGDSRLDQCFELGSDDIRPHLFVWTTEPSADLSVRVNVDFYTDAACSTDASAAQLRQDYDLDIPPGQWTPLVLEEVRAAAEFGNATWALLSIRVRDRSDPESNNPGPVARRLLIDDVSAAAVVVPPVFTPVGGTYPGAVDVTLTSPEPDATIFFTLDGTDPDTTSMSVPNGSTIMIGQTSTLTARAAIGESLSAPRSAVYTLETTEVSPPMFDPAPGVFAAPVDVTLSTSTAGATIFFTLDGSAPSIESDSVANGGTVTISETSTLRARAALGETLSAETSGAYTIDIEEVTVLPPEFSPAPGEFDAPVTVTLSSLSEGATIFFTLDGSEPTAESDSVASGGSVTIEETSTLTAIAAIEGNLSAATVGEYSIVVVDDEPSVEAPEFAPPGGTFVEAVTVTLSTATEGAVIRFTLDGSDPTAESESVESGGELTFTETTELRALADLEGELSEITTATYEIQEGVTDDSLANGAFGELNPRPAEVTYGQGGGPPGWRLVVNERTENDGGRVQTGDAFAGEAWFAFNQLSGGFGDNKLEQCVAIDATRRIDISYRVFTDFDLEEADMRVRINPNFYANFEDCLTAVAQDSGGNRLSGGRNNDDVDFSIGTRRDEWIRQGPAEAAGLRYEVADLPEGSTWMRLSVRARARDGQGDPISPSPVVRLDDIRVTQGTATTNLLVNGSFEQIELRDRDFLAGGEGWFVDRDGDESLRAAAGPVDFALVGSNVFFFEDLSENFGDSRLDQCVVLDGETLQPALFVRSSEPADGVSLRVNVDFYPEADCEGDADADARLRQDFDLDVGANEWVNLVTDEERGPAEYGDAQTALLSLRMRDRSGLAVANAPSTGGGLQIAQAVDGGGGSLSRRIFLDAVSLVSGVPVPDPGPDPDPDPPPGVDPDPQPEPPGPLRSSGCSASGEPGPFDPTLWLLALIAGLALHRRRRVTA